MVIPRGCWRSDNSGEEKLCTPDSGDMSSLSNMHMEGVYGGRTMEKWLCTPDMHMDVPDSIDA
jgi:hypothetical protein